MNEDTEKKVQDLLKRVEALEAWKAERANQQLTYPLDFVSQQIISGV